MFQQNTISCSLTKKKIKSKIKTYKIIKNNNKSVAPLIINLNKHKQ